MTRRPPAKRKAREWFLHYFPGELPPSVDAYNPVDHNEEWPGDHGDWPEKLNWECIRVREVIPRKRAVKARRKGKS